MGAAQVFGLRHAHHSPQLARSLSGVDEAARIEEITNFTQRVTKYDDTQAVLGDDLLVYDVLPEGIGKASGYRLPGTRTIAINNAVINRSGSYVAGTAMHEAIHVIQAGRSNSTMQRLLDWAVDAGKADNLSSLINLVPGYAVNPVEIAARQSAILSKARINMSFDLSLRALEGVTYWAYNMLP